MHDDSASSQPPAPVSAPALTDPFFHFDRTPAEILAEYQRRFTGGVVPKLTEDDLRIRSTADGRFALTTTGTSPVVLETFDDPFGYVLSERFRVWLDPEHGPTPGADQGASPSH